MVDEDQYREYDALRAKIKPLKTELYNILAELEEIEHETVSVEQPVEELKAQVLQLELRVNKAFKSFKK